jgi:hypothetical protein
MRHMTYAAAALLAAMAACTASGSEDPPTSPAADDDGGAPADAGDVMDDDDATAPVRDAGVPDAERPLVCGDAGFCETKLPASETGQPLSLQSVWVVASNDVWSVSADGLVIHFDGTEWKTEYRANHALSVVWATPTSVWVGGELGLLLNRNAAGQWSQVETGHSSNLRTIAGRSDDDVWFSRADGLVDHYDGTVLRPHPMGIADLRVMTVFSGPTATYAAGYVNGPPVVLNVNTVPNRYPYVLELTEEGATVYNTNLPTTAAAKGFVPMSAQVTDAASDDDRIFVFGYYLQWNPYENAFGSQPQYMRLGPSSTIKKAAITVPNGRAQWFTPETAIPRKQPIWAKDWSNILLPFAEPYVYIFMMRWNGSAFAPGSLAMGRDFVPRDVFGIHGNSTDTWVVGDGFALKGPTP